MTTTATDRLTISPDDWEAIKDDIALIKGKLDEVIPGSGSAGETLVSRVARLERDWDRIFGTP